MLFKTISASVYGIDAYIVEVEVDVGSARMQDFNVVGLPDNAVKESRERIKSALRNCGFEFLYGQGVTINLAPADARKEGSDSICLWHWDWPGAWGNFLASRWTSACFWANYRWMGACDRCAGRFPPLLRLETGDCRPLPCRKRMHGKRRWWKASRYLH